jgi:tetratricopeptide (TPR) repeat protein
MAGIYRDTGRPQEALKLFEQSVQLAEQVANPAYQVAALVGLGQLLYRYLNLPAEAITSLEQAISLLQATGLPQDAAGHTIEQLQQALVAMRAGIFPRAGGPSTLPSAHIQQIVSNTLAVMTMAQDHLSDWREQMREALRDAQHRGTDWQIEADFFTAVLDILDGRSPILPADHPYAQAVTAIEQGIAAGGPERVSVSDEVMQAIREFVNSEDWDSARRVVEARRELLFRPEVEAFFEQNIEQAIAAGEERAIRLLELHLTVLRECKTQGIAQTFERLAARREQEHLPFDAELIPRSIKALLGGPQEKMEPAQYLAALSAQATDEQLKALIHAIQLALFGGDRSRLGQNLEGVYRRAWEAIVVGVETEGVDPRLFEAIVRHTLAVLGSDANRQSEWRKNLLQMRDQATTGGAKQLVALLDAVLGLLDAGGNPTGLGAGLTGIYEQIWKELVSHLHHQE